MLEIGVLGAVEARVDGRGVPLGGPRQRLVLAHLALSLGQTVSIETLLDDLWRRPPRDPLHALQAHVSRLRSCLPVDLVHTGSGYSLTDQGLRLDARIFEQQHAEGVRLLTAGRPSEASAMLQEALALWRGPALDGLRESTALAADIARLERMRVTALGDRIDADLACGRTADLVVELSGMVMGEPTVERHWIQLMTALHRDGHVAEALEAYRRARAGFIKLLGTEPSATLRHVHRAVLRGDEIPPLRQATPGPEPDAPRVSVASSR